MTFVKSGANGADGSGFRCGPSSGVPSRRSIEGAHGEAWTALTPILAAARSRSGSLSRRLPPCSRNDGRRVNGRPTRRPRCCAAAPSLLPVALHIPAEKRWVRRFWRTRTTPPPTARYDGPTTTTSYDVTRRNGWFGGAVSAALKRIRIMRYTRWSWRGPPYAWRLSCKRRRHYSVLKPSIYSAQRHRDTPARPLLSEGRAWCCAVMSPVNDIACGNRHWLFGPTSSRSHSFFVVYHVTLNCTSPPPL